MTSIGAVTLADVGTSAGAALGVPAMVDRLGLGPARHVVVCLIDGLGWQVVRVIKEDRPDDILARVDDVLRSRGWRPETAPTARPTRVLSA